MSWSYFEQQLILRWISCPVSKPETAKSGCPLRAGLANSECSASDPVVGLEPGKNIEPTADEDRRQKPGPDQPFLLTKSRFTSSIPKGFDANGTPNFWVYPSAQMFWNAITRKGWKWQESEKLEASDIENVIGIHNLNNERTWREILKWEALHHKECKRPFLARFHGNNDRLSPRARIRTWLGHERPFDRHDWYVDRCGKIVHYVIDYYSLMGSQDLVESNQNPPDSNGEAKEPVYELTPKMVMSGIDVRPAMDSFSSFFDRAYVSWMRIYYQYFDSK